MPTRQIGKYILAEGHFYHVSNLPGFIRKAGYFVLGNVLVETIIVSAIGLTYLAVRIVDGLLHTKLKRRLMKYIHELSRDDLNILRKTQIRYLFRKKYRLKKITIRLAGGSYWMSIPCIIEGRHSKTKNTVRYMAKIINDRSALKHRYMTILRNMGVLAEGIDMTFDGHDDAHDMIQFERNSLMLLKNRQVNVPEVYGIHRLNHEDYVLVMQYIDGKPLSKVELTEAVIDQIFALLKMMHDTGVFHGDIKLDNFLMSDGKLFVVDCLKIDREELWKAQDFDLICAICALAQRVPVSVIMENAGRYHSAEELKRAGKLLGITLNKVDLDLSEERVKEIQAYEPLTAAL